MATARHDFHTDPEKWAFLPAELKQNHGDGFIIADERDDNLTDHLCQMVDGLQALDDEKPPYVTHLDDACVWVTALVDRYDMCMQYFTLIFCIITENVLESRYFADAALISSLEEHKDVFIPVFKNREEYAKLKQNQDMKEKLPTLYRIVKPLYLDSASSIDGLKKLLNSHLSEKLKRIKQQDQEIERAFSEMERNNSTLVDNSTLSCQENERPSLPIKTTTTSFSEPNSIPETVLSQTQQYYSPSPPDSQVQNPNVGNVEAQTLDLTTGADDRPGCHESFNERSCAVLENIDSSEKQNQLPPTSNETDLLKQPEPGENAKDTHKQSVSGETRSKREGTGDASTSRDKLSKSFSSKLLSLQTVVIIGSTALAAYYFLKKFKR